MLALLGTAAPPIFGSGSPGSAMVARSSIEFQARAWGASDGQVIDRYGLHWLIGFEGDESD